MATIIRAHEAQQTSRVRALRFDELEATPSGDAPPRVGFDLTLEAP